MGAGCVDRPRSLNDLRLVQKTWRSAVEKAEDPEFQWLHDIADHAAPAVRSAFLRAIDKLKEGSTVESVRQALASGNVESVMRALGLGPELESTIAAAIMPPIEDTFVEAGRTAPTKTVPATRGGQMPFRGGQPAGELQMRFDISNPETTRFINNYEFGMIRDVSNDTRAAVRQVVLDAFRFGGHPTEQARTIRGLVGLTRQQTAAVNSFRNLLENGDPAALQRMLRDRRFDPTLRRTLGQAADRQLSQEQIDRQVERYAENSLKARAENIARTETLRAANAAQHVAWGNAVDAGLLDAQTLRVKWLVTPDDRLCIYCAEVPILNPNGVLLGQMFKTALGDVPYPPLHPQCRCTTFIDSF